MLGHSRLARIIIFEPPLKEWQKPCAVPLEAMPTRPKSLCSDLLSSVTGDELKKGK
jgi:hypothetical protein